MKKGEWIRSIWLKAPAFILAVALVPIITLSLLALWFGYDCGWWTEQPTSFYDTPIIKSAVQQYTWYVWDEYEGAFVDFLYDSKLQSLVLEEEPEREDRK